MTTTNVNVGLSEGKSSSRVLKAPGGGHTDIFGLNDEVKEAAPRSKQQSNSDSIKNCFTMEDNCNNTNIKANPKEPKETEITKTATTQTQRARIPPGGHSTGFW